MCEDARSLLSIGFNQGYFRAGARISCRCDEVFSDTIEDRTLLVERIIYWPHDDLARQFFLDFGLFVSAAGLGSDVPKSRYQRY